MKKILIVDSAGYIGSHVNLELNRHGYKTIVYDNLSCGYRNFIQNFKFIEGDLNNDNDLNKISKIMISCL